MITNALLVVFSFNDVKGGIIINDDDDEVVELFINDLCEFINDLCEFINERDDVRLIHDDIIGLFIEVLVLKIALPANDDESMECELILPRLEVYRTGIWGAKSSGLSSDNVIALSPDNAKLII